MVSLTLWELLSQACMAATVCELDETDVGITFASASDIGGLSRGVLAALVSGGSILCDESEHCSQFWELLQRSNFSWCLASMESYRKILTGVSLRYLQINSLRSGVLRLACGADGAVPTDMAALIRDTFSCMVRNLPHKPEYTNNVSSQCTKDTARETSSSPNDRTHSSRHAKEPNTRLQIKEDEDSLSKKLRKTDNKGGTWCTDRNYIKPTLATGRGNIEALHSLETDIERHAATPNSPLFNRITRSVAISVRDRRGHESLVVVVVPARDALRIDLRALCHALGQSYWETPEPPQLMVYMDTLPQDDSDLLRDVLSKYLDIPALSDDTSYLGRHWEAVWPTMFHATPELIPVTRCRADSVTLQNAIQAFVPGNFTVYMETDFELGGFEVYVAPEEALSGNTTKDMRQWAEYIKRALGLSLDALLIPERLHILTEPVGRDEHGNISYSHLRGLRAKHRKASIPEHLQSIEDGVASAFMNVLSCEDSTIDYHSTFFQLGGTESSAQALAAALRVEFNISLPQHLISDRPTIRGISDHIEELYIKNQEQEQQHRNPYSSTRWWLLLLQLVPLVTLYPARRAWQLTFQLWLLSRTRFWEDNDDLTGRVGNLLLSIFGGWASVQVIFPLIGIILKWALIGRYKESLYPMWGFYHTKWWLVQKIVSLCDLGVFDYSFYGRRLYCRLMGAKIGKSVTLTNVQLGEWDLLDIRDGASLSNCICRPFAVEKNSNFYLSRIVIGERSSIGALSIVAPGTEVLPDTYLGASTSSWEQGQLLPQQGDTQLMKKPQDPHWLLFLCLTVPMYVIGNFIALLPWIGPQIAVLYKPPQKSTTPLRVILDWYQGSPQVAYTYVAVMAQALFSPALFLAWVVLIRYCCQLVAAWYLHSSASMQRQLGTWKKSIIKTLYSASKLAEINTLLGQHHGARSAVLKLLGARVGSRVRWPSSGPCLTDYELLNIGNNVSFGFDCHLFTTDEHGSGGIKISNDAVIADHVCVLPGVEIGSKTVLGFGTLTRRGQRYDSGKTYIGREKGGVAESASRETQLSSLDGFPDKLENNVDQHVQNDTEWGFDQRGDDAFRLEKGAQRSSDSPRSIPSSDLAGPDRKVHATEPQPPRYHFSPGLTLIISLFMTIFTVFYWNVPALSSMKLAARIFVEYCGQEASLVDPMVLYGLSYLSTMVLTTLFAILALMCVIMTKRLVIGGLKPGDYRWDDSSYFQRRQVLIAIEKIIRRCYVHRGILSLLTGTHWLVLYYRALGAKIGENCALFANGYPSLLITESDLIEIGDNVAIDDVGIIPHVEREGSVRLGKIKIGDRCVLRSGSHILCGGVMKNDSCLLEHTLIMPGQVVEEGCTMYRRPAKQFYGNRKGSLPEAS
ncbi:hypothetical protein NLG97_g2351 [Lecanicillium saksenae]|uniref:Uncharacterized protein n=1 Tax=Lecanicillium saksenae TaxID=468837 RepID=A0ACC1R139_9HYPO|nr:hypothetical protein NLG97_g2351 [Lecanicillium saksenae]